MTIAECRPVFATRNPLLIGGVREVLMGAGITADPRIVVPEELGRALARAEHCLVIVDAESLPHRDVLTRLCESIENSVFVLWAARPTADLLQAAMECGVHGLLSAGLPLEEAADALVRICHGERLFRFDPDAGPIANAQPLHLSSRERQVLFVLAEGATNAGIAAALNTTQSTVKVCLSRLFRKTGARNRLELVEFTRNGVAAAVEPREQPAPASFDEEWMLESGHPRREDR